MLSHTLPSWAGSQRTPNAGKGRANKYICQQPTLLWCMQKLGIYSLVPRPGLFSDLRFGLTMFETTIAMCQTEGWNNTARVKPPVGTTRVPYVSKPVRCDTRCVSNGQLEQHASYVSNRRLEQHALCVKPTVGTTRSVRVKPPVEQHALCVKPTVGTTRAVRVKPPVKQHALCVKPMVGTTRAVRVKTCGWNNTRRVSNQPSL